MSLQGWGKQLDALWNNLAKGTSLIWASETLEDGWKGKNANTANDFIAFILELLFYDKMRWDLC